MSTPKTFWRLRIESEAAFRTMIATSTATGPDSEFLLKVTRGHGICLASYDHGTATGLVRAMGIVTGAEGGRLRVTWRETSVSVRPNGQGQQYWVNRPYFTFAKAVAERYRLAERFAALFPTSQIPPTGNTDQNTVSGGYVYLIKSEYGYKIGKTKNMKQRTQLFGVKLPFSIEIAGYGWFDNYSAAEAEYHRRYAHKRLDGEWFKLSESDVLTISRELKGGFKSEVQRRYDGSVSVP